MNLSCLLLPAIKPFSPAAKPSAFVSVAMAILPHASSFSLEDKNLSAKKEETGEVQ